MSHGWNGRRGEILGLGYNFQTCESSYGDDEGGEREREGDVRFEIFPGPSIVTDDGGKLVIVGGSAIVSPEGG